MKKFFSILVVAAVTLVVIPSCSTSDSLDEVIEANELNVAAETDDQELPIAKSDNDQARC